MGKRHPNYRLVKQNRTYTVSDIAALFEVHKNTVRAWRKAGLQPIDGKKPALFRGMVLAAFLESRRTNAKHPLRPGEIFCVACRSAKKPALGIVHYVPLGSTSGDLRGLCPTCGRRIHRRVSLAKLFETAAPLKVTITEPPPTLGDSVAPSLNCDFGKEAAHDKLSPGK